MILTLKIVYVMFGHALFQTSLFNTTLLKNDEWAVSNYMLACINVFINLNGHEVLIERLSDKESKVTFNLLRQYLNLLWRVCFQQ